MKAIVTGACGFLGRHLVEYLLAKNCQIIAVGRNRAKSDDLFQDRVMFKTVDLRNHSEVIQQFENADVVFHCAALSSVWGCNQDFYEHNVIATKNCMDACQYHAIKRMIYVSSPSIYFDYKPRFNITEQDPLPEKFVNAYAQTKYQAECVVKQKQSSSLETVILRPRGIFGEYDTSIMPRIIKIAEKGVFPRFNRQGTQVDFTYVKNVAHALYLAAVTENAAGQVYNITNDEPCILENVLAHVFQTLKIKTRYSYIPYPVMDTLARGSELIYKNFSKQEPPLTRYSLGVLAIGQTLCIDKAKQELNYAPLFTVNEGLERYVNWKL